MSEADEKKNEKNTQAPEAAAPKSSPETSRPAAGPASEKPVGKSSGGKGLAALALLVGLAGLGVGGYALMQQQRLAGLDQQMAEGLGPLKGLPEQLRQLGERQDQLGGRLQSLDKLPSADELEQRGRLLGALQSGQQQLRERVEQVLGSSREHWRLAEAEYLVRMAMLRLSAMQDVESAIALLNEADLILRKQDDPGAYAARQALVQSLEALHSLPELDRTGLFLQLGALQNQAAQVAALAPEFQIKDEPAEAPGQSTWDRWLGQLDRYVQIEFDSNVAVKPLLAGESLAQVRLALSLAMEQAQWAVLNGNGEVYRQSLDQAIGLLASQFSADNEDAKALSRRLEELRKRQVEVQLPDMTPTLRALQAYVEERQRDALEAPGKGQPPTAEPTPKAAPAQPAPEPEPAVGTDDKGLTT